MRDIIRLVLVHVKKSELEMKWKKKINDYSSKLRGPYESAQWRDSCEKSSIVFLSLWGCENVEEKKYKKKSTFGKEYTILYV